MVIISKGNGPYQLPSNLGTNINIQHSAYFQKIVSFKESIERYYNWITEAALVDFEVNEWDVEHEPSHDEEEGVQEL